jgi:hypothetical protein
MRFAVHYQERTNLKYVNGEVVQADVITNVLVTFEDFCDMYDQFQIEDLLNRMGEWDDNGVTENDEELQNRVVYVVCTGNVEDYSKDHGVHTPEISKKFFISCVGYEPINDDLERCNCACKGTSGHTMCGWNWSKDRPNFMCLL